MLNKLDSELDEFYMNEISRLMKLQADCDKTIAYYERLRKKLRKK